VDVDGCLDLAVDVDLDKKTVRKEKSRTGSTTGASAVENTGVLGLGFNPNWHIKENKQEVKVANRSNAGAAQRRAWRRLLSNTYSITGAQVIAHAA
jgi:hypothetical protein